uniref:GMC family oxidoreductase n=1 Tax=Roseihalotalea indica TaxID=2867963 RepID=A0AA49GR41_9BACT|nr:GMC family oxidoreductase [Tunicatimonas sp. TK19036]
MYISAQGKEENTYDAIVIGSGISGGYAAKELCEKGLKTLVLERGRMVKHGEYPTATKEPWQLPHRGQTPPEEIQEHYPKQSRTGYTIQEASKHWFVKDSEHPYQETKRFDWMRGYHVGGRSLMWGRHSYRWSDLDFEANAKDGHGVDWPIRYKDIAPWYDYVESFVGIHGIKEGLPQLPDGNFLPPMDFNCLEQHFREKVAENFGGRVVTMGRTANLTQDHNGRTKCQYRNRCIRGCPYGAYFSSNAATLPVAEATGNLTIRPDSIVTSIIYDKEKRKAVGVQVIDRETNEALEFYSKIVFCCASAIASTSILMNSKSDAFPDGIGASSGELGHNIMDHHFRVGASGEHDGFADKYYYGRKPTGFYIPRFRNLDAKTQQKDYLRGFGYQGGGSRDSWQSAVAELGFGTSLKEKIVIPGPWNLGMTAFAETLPYHENKMTLDYDNTDKWGQPTVVFDAEFKENEIAMRKDMANSAAEMLEAAGCKNVHTYDSNSWPGLGIHEMGTARMGRDPKTSVLNKWNQVHDVTNVYVTDGACMTSASCVNPSLTYMALTARAVDHAVSELKKMNV